MNSPQQIVVLQVYILAWKLTIVISPVERINWQVKCIRCSRNMREIKMISEKLEHLVHWRQTIKGPGYVTNQRLRAFYTAQKEFLSPAIRGWKKRWIQPTT